MSEERERSALSAAIAEQNLRILAVQALRADGDSETQATEKVRRYFKALRPTFGQPEAPRSQALENYAKHIEEANAPLFDRPATVYLAGPHWNEIVTALRTTPTEELRRGNYDPNETPEAKAARLAKVEEFVRGCEGWKLVPPDATEKMKMAGGWLYRGVDGYVINREQAGVIYKAMLDAAPTTAPSPLAQQSEPK